MEVGNGIGSQSGPTLRFFLEFVGKPEANRLRSRVIGG